MRIVVDFPAPLGPRNPTTWPRSTANETWSTAVTPSNRFETPSTERKGIRGSERVYGRSDGNHTPPHSSRPPHLLELLGRTIDHVRHGLQRLAGRPDLRVALRPAFLLDRLAHARKRLYAIARVEARSIDLVTVPRPARQSRRARERAFRAEQDPVHGLRVRLGEGRAAVGLGARQGFLIALRRARQRVGRVVERREVQKRGKLLPRGGHVGLARIGGGREQALVELAVQLPDLIMLVFGEFLGLSSVLRQGFGLPGGLLRHEL